MVWPIEPEVARKGNEGNLAHLGQTKLEFTHEFAKLAEQVVSSKKFETRFSCYALQHGEQHTKFSLKTTPAEKI